MAQVRPAARPRRRGPLAVALICACGLSLVGAWANAAAPAGKTIYSGVTVISPDHPRPTPGMAIVVEGERITAVEPVAQLTEAQRKDAVIYPAQGRYALPGLIDSHVHLATDPDRAYAEAELKRELYAGVTGVRDMAGDARMLPILPARRRWARLPRRTSSTRP